MGQRGLLVCRVFLLPSAAPKTAPLDARSSTSEVWWAGKVAKNAGAKVADSNENIFGEKEAPEALIPSAHHDIPVPSYTEGYTEGLLLEA